MSENIRHPFLRLSDTNQPYRDQLVKAAIRVIDSGTYIGGTEVSALENELAELCKTRHAVCVSNGLDALRLILKAYIEMGMLRYGDHVIVPDMTFVATALAVSDCGLVPVTVDVSLSTCNLDSMLVEQAISPRTRAIIPVHLYGRVCCDDHLIALVRKHNLIMIEDAAQAIGAESTIPGLNGTHSAGSLGHAAAFSFYPTKNIGALGDAGAVVTNDSALAETIRTLANYGYRGSYNSVLQGYNCRMDSIQAAMLRVKLPHTDEENLYRRAQAAEYSRLIDNPFIIKPAPANDKAHIYYQYVILVCNPDDRSIQNYALRERFRKHMLANGIETGVHYPQPIHSQPCFPELNDLELPVSTMIADSVVSLPIGRTTSLADISDIANAVNSFKP